MSKRLNSGLPLPQRQRNTLRFRRIIVTKTELIAEQFWRVQFNGADLAGFDSPGYDDHIKLFFPTEGGLALPSMTDEGIQWPNQQRPESRDYTPLHFSTPNSLTIDFYRHQGGVASGWAEKAKPGDSLIIGGPRGSLVVPTLYQQQLYILDETGLPALKRRLALLEQVKVKVIVFADPEVVHAYLQPLAANIELQALGTGKMDSQGAAQAIALCQDLLLPEDDYYIWLTGEGAAVKQLSDHFISQRGCNPDLVRAVAYWHHKAEAKS